MMPVAHGGEHVDNRYLGLQRLLRLRRLLLIPLEASIPVSFSRCFPRRKPRQRQCENARRKAGHAHCIIPLEIVADWYDAPDAPPDVSANMPGAQEIHEARKRPKGRKRDASMIRTILALGITLFFSLSAAAQVQPQPAPQQAPPATPQKPAAKPPAGQQGTAPETDARTYIKVHTEVVVVPVTVKDRDGHLVEDLQEQDFRVFQDGVEQQIVRFSSDPFPLSAVVLIDNDLTQKQAGQVQKSLIAIAAGFGPSDEVALVTYDQLPHTVSDFSFSNDFIFTELKRIELGSHFSISNSGPLAAGPTINGQSQETGVPVIARKESMTKDLDDAVYAAGEMLKGRGRDRRKIIFLISDGNNSKY